MLLCLAARARAWDDFGHMEIAAVAWARLPPAARTRASALLRLNPSYPNWIVGAKPADRARAAFLRAATWPDAIKSDPRYRDDAQDAPTADRNVGYADRLRHKYWHYVDQPLSPDGTAHAPAPTPNAATRIAAFRAVLATPGGSEDVKSYDLVWLLHLVGDVHQPLHCVSRYDREDPNGDRGGNAVRITGNAPPPVCDEPRFCPYGPPGNLHAYFDDRTGSSYSIAGAESAAARLPAPSARQAAVLDETVWIHEGLELARERVYVTPIGVGDGPFALDAAYQKASLALARQRIALAGARLANLLVDCFAREAGRRAPRLAAGRSYSGRSPTMLTR